MTLDRHPEWNLFLEYQAGRADARLTTMAAARLDEGCDVEEVLELVGEALRMFYPACPVTRTTELEAVRCWVKRRILLTAENGP